MADENQELQRQMDELRSSFQGLDTATKNANVGLQAFGKAAKALPAEITKGMAGFAKQVQQGDTSLKSLNSVVDVAANAVGGLAKTIPYVGEALSALAKGVAEGAKIVVEQLDATAKTFNQISASGAAAADGMTGLYRQFTTAGLSLQQFQKVIGQNSVALARFRGLAGDGAEDFSKAVGQLTLGQDTTLRKLGMSAEDIGDTAAAFVTQQTRLGRSQAMSADDLAKGTKQYALELDQLSKVTGLSRAAIQKQQDAALSESRFRAVYEEMMANGQTDAAKSLMDFQTRMSSFGKELGQGIRDLSSGATTTAAATDMMVSTGGAAADIISRLQSRAIDENQAQKELQEAYQRQGKMMRDNAKYMGDSNAVLTNFADKADFMAANIEGNGMKAAKTQSDQINKTDKLTKETIEAQQNLEKMNIEMNKLAFTLMPDAAKATAVMTKAMLDMVKWVRQKIGGEEPSAPSTSSGEVGANSGAMGMGGDEIMAAVGAATPATSTTPTVKKLGQQDLSKMGLKIKAGDVQGEGNDISSNLITLAQKIQQSVPGFAYFSGFNDKYHQDSGSSKHPRGLALDFALAQAPSADAGRAITEQLRNLGASYVQDEYNNPSSRSTGGHIHAEVSAARGAILSGPMGGYKPNLTMHGTEAVVPLNSPAAASMGLDNSEGNSLMAEQIVKLDEMISVLKSQLSVSTKIMQFAS
jgi:hypothetical protein